MNNDGYTDVIIGESPEFTSTAGAAYVFFGSDDFSATSLDVSALDGTNGFKIEGTEAGDYAGTSVAGAGVSLFSFAYRGRTSVGTDCLKLALSDRRNCTYSPLQQSKYLCFSPINKHNISFVHDLPPTQHGEAKVKSSSAGPLRRCFAISQYGGTLLAVYVPDGANEGARSILYANAIESSDYRNSCCSAPYRQHGFSTL